MFLTIYPVSNHTRDILIMNGPCSNTMQKIILFSTNLILSELPKDHHTNWSYILSIIRTISLSFTPYFIGENRIQKSEARSLKTEDHITVLGIMSGTSLDGLDLALCRFLPGDGKWKYAILECTTLPYDQSLKGKLRNAMMLSGLQLAQLDIEFGTFIGNQCRQFILRNKVTTDLIASHGHTIFHQPHKGLTVQIGNGSEITAQTGIPTVCDFRKKDVALGGEGAPLVPVGDELLFSQYSYCLNLGGFANVSFKQEAKRRAFDICPVNIVLNEMAGLNGQDFDRDGELGKQGSVNNDLLERLNKILLKESS